MLPHDQRLGQYGGRTVHAVAADSHGRIYAGTDLGLLIYDAGGGVASLMIDNDMSSEVFNDKAVERLQQISELLLDKYDSNSEPGRILETYRKVEQDIQELQEHIEGGITGMAGTNTPDISPEAGDTPQGGVARSDLKQRLQVREQARQRLLHRLENEHYGLFQLLKLDPRELSAFHKELSAGQAVVQYLPTPKTLYIQLVTQDGAQIREVDVTEEELYQRAGQAAAQLKELAFGLSRGAKSLLVEDESGPDLTSELAWLYDQLLRPVERELAVIDHVFVVPIGALTYLPFPALVYELKDQPRYAVEQFAMGVLPSLFHLQLVLRHQASYLDSSLLIGDPDGTLPAAREEVKEIHQLLPDARPPLIGNDATIENFQQQAVSSRILHLATHGKLNHESPADSYLLMADGYRLSVVDISLLDLRETDLVVLSACESGIGRDGLEYATLARSFAHANVPSVVASLWRVNDSATRQLMSNFYSNFVTGKDIFSSFAEAQRSMISEKDGWSHPAAWSGFLVFGKP